MNKNKLRIIFLFVATTLIPCSLSAQSKLDLQSKLTLLKERGALPILTQNKSTLRKAEALNTQRSMMSLVRMNDDSAIENMELQGAKVFRVRGNIAIVSIPLDRVEQIAELKSVSKIHLAQKLYPKMDRVREVTGIDKIHSGLELPQAFTGKGVVTGIVDNGFEPNHINFLDADGNTRFGYMSRITATTTNKDGYIYENYYPREELTDDEDEYTYAIEDFKTDDKTTYHGTHTLGIMAGGYKGEVKNAKYNGVSTTIGTESNPYYGCATESEIVASCGDLYDSFILFGMEDAIAYAQYSNGIDADGNPVKEKPCVINLSLGSNLGPHDKNSMMNQYLSELGKYAVICCSAGNEADYPICLHKTFTTDDTSLQSFIHPIMEGEYASGDYSYNNLRYGSFEVFSDDDTEFEIQLVVYNTARNKIAARMPVSTNTEGSYVVYVSDTSYYSDGTVNATFAKGFDGYLAIATAIDEDTGRYYATVDLMTSDNQDSNADGNYKLGVVINGKDGQTVDIYGDAQYTYFSGEDCTGWEDGTADGSISDMAVSDNVVVVGSYNTREKWGTLDGGFSSYAAEFPEGDITSFSSYGTLADGETLPTVCAPGASVISSSNAYCVENSDMGYTEANLQAECTANNRNYYWHQAIGTSMATPVVAGGIALWLEADPTLTVDDVLDIIRTTAIKDDYVNSGSAVQWGAGKFDAYAGLKEVLNRQAEGINDVKQNDGKVVINQNGEKSFSVYVAGEKTMKVNIFNAGGQRVFSKVTSGDEANVDVNGLSNGVYIVKVNGCKAQRIIIKD